jgi:hypothetical protein
MIWRQKVSFDDVPLHSCMIDVDNFHPTVDPIINPVAAIDQYIKETLPSCFHEISCPPSCPT